MKKTIFLSIGFALALCSCNSGNSTIDSLIDSIDTSADSVEVSESEIVSTSEEESTSIPAVGFSVTFDVDEHATLTVYTTKNYDEVDTDTNIQTRNGDTGEYCNNGEDSQVNFKLVADEGYEIEAVTATTGTYNKVKWPTDTEVENGYRITKVTGDTVITVTTKSSEEEAEGYKVSFVLEHCSVQVHIGKDATTTDTPDLSGDYFTRDKDSGEFTKNSDTAQVNFTIIPEDGYEFNSGVAVDSEAKANTIEFITGTFNKLKNNGNNYYTVTKVSSDLVITIACTAI